MTSKSQHKAPPMQLESNNEGVIDPNRRRRAHQEMDDNRQAHHNPGNHLSFVQAEKQKSQKNLKKIIAVDSDLESVHSHVSAISTATSKRNVNLNKSLSTISSGPGNNNNNVIRRQSAANPATSKKATIVLSTKAASFRKLSNKGSSLLKKAQSTQHLNKSIRSKQHGWLTKLLQYVGIYYHDVELTDPAAIEAVEALGITQSQLRKLKVKFNKIDIDSSGTIDSDEFFESVGGENTPFSVRLFTLIDIDGSGTIEFDEYVRVLATYCMYSKDEILRFCFECFDLDGSGSIDEKEFVQLCKTVNNAAPAFPENFRRALDDFDRDRDGLIDYAEFVEIDRRFPLILFPAFRLQDLMQRNTLGEYSWLQIRKRYAKRTREQVYRDNHGGMDPPDSFGKTVIKTILPCLFKEKKFIQMGQEMENRHRAQQNLKAKAPVGSKKVIGKQTPWSSKTR